MIGRFSNLGSYKELLLAKDFLRVGFAGLLALVGFFLDKGNEIYSTIGLTLILISVGVNGIPIILEAIQGLIKKKANVDELVSIAIIASLISGHYLEAAVVSFVMVLGSLIEQATSESARKAIKSLINISPQQATVVTGEKTETKHISEIKTDDILLVKPGERIPVDALIINGVTSVDESSITGEPIPNEKKPGDEVYAGTLNQNGVLKIKTTKIGEDTTLGKVVKLVSDAEAHKPESIALIDRYAKWFTPFILTCAAIAWVITQDPNRAVTVLIVGCPCALILAAPTAIVAAISRAAKEGILIKGGNYLEKAALADVILFDKTGTLTEGNPTVDQIIPSSPEINKNFILEQAACVEQNSTHPLAKAVLKAAHYSQIVISAAEDVITEIGIGVRGCIKGCSVEIGSAYLSGGTMTLPENLQKPLESIKQKGATPLVVYRDKLPLGIISVSDHVRPNAQQTLKELSQLNMQKIGILSGDHKKSVELVSKTVGATDSWSQLKPQDKLTIVKNLQSSGHKVMFVGDGINDAPALAISEVGIAMAAKGTEVALETADIALMHDDISKLPFLIRLSRRTIPTIKWNIAFGLTFNLIAIIAGGSGLLTPIMGAIVHNVGSVLVVLSSASIGFASNKA